MLGSDQNMNTKICFCTINYKSIYDEFLGFATGNILHTLGKYTYVFFLMQTFNYLIIQILTYWIRPQIFRTYL